MFFYRFIKVWFWRLEYLGLRPDEILCSAKVAVLKLSQRRTAAQSSNFRRTLSSSRKQRSTAQVNLLQPARFMGFSLSPRSVTYQYQRLKDALKANKIKAALCGHGRGRSSRVGILASSPQTPHLSHNGQTIPGSYCHMSVFRGPGGMPPMADRMSTNFLSCYTGALAIHNLYCPIR